MRKSLPGIAWLGIFMLAAGSAVVLAQNRAVPTTFDIDDVSDTVVITRASTSGDTIVDTVTLSGEISIRTTVVPPNPIRVSALVSLSGVSEATSLCYIAAGGSTLRPTDPYAPGDPYHVTFTTRLIALHPTDPYAPVAPCDEDASTSRAIPQAAVIYPLMIEATLAFDDEGLLIAATIDDLSVPGLTLGD